MLILSPFYHTWHDSGCSVPEGKSPGFCFGSYCQKPVISLHTFSTLICVFVWFCFLCILNKTSLLQILENCRVYLNKFTSHFKESHNNLGNKRSGDPTSCSKQVLWHLIASCPITELLRRVPPCFLYTLPLGRWRQNTRSSLSFLFPKRRQKFPLFSASPHVTSISFLVWSWPTMHVYYFISDLWYEVK